MLELRPDEGALTLEFSVRLTLSRAIEDALRRGVALLGDALQSLRGGARLEQVVY